MKDHLNMGVYCNSDRQFYIMDCGSGSYQHAVDKIRTILIARDLIKLTDQKSPTNGYRICSLAEAKLNDYPIVTLYANKHIRTMREREQSKPVEQDLWG